MGGGEAVRVAPAHDHVRAGPREMLRREISESGVGARHEVGAAVLRRHAEGIALLRLGSSPRCRAYVGFWSRPGRRAGNVGGMPELFVIVIALTCVSVIVMGIRAVRRMNKSGRDDDDMFGPRR